MLQLSVPHPHRKLIWRMTMQTWLCHLQGLGDSLYFNNKEIEVCHVKLDVEVWISIKKFANILSLFFSMKYPSSKITSPCIFLYHRWNAPLHHIIQYAQPRQIDNYFSSSYYHSSSQSIARHDTTWRNMTLDQDALEDDVAARRVRDLVARSQEAASADVRHSIKSWLSACQSFSDSDHRPYLIFLYRTLISYCCRL